MNVMTTAWRSSWAATVCCAALAVGTVLRADDPLEKSVEAKTKDHGKLVEHGEAKGSDGQEGQKQKIQAIREQAERLQKEGRTEEAEKLMRHAKEMMGELQGEGVSRRDSADDVRGQVQQLQRELKEVREQLRQLQEQQRKQEDRR